MMRRVNGESMLPHLPSGRIVMGWRWFRRIRPGDVVILHHQGVEKVKRVQRVQDGELFVMGYNAAASTDSRHFGTISPQLVLAKIIYPRRAVQTAPDSL